MRILVINPVGHPTWDETDKRIYESFASPDTSVEVVSLPRGPATVETPESHAEVIPLVVETIKKHREAYDAFIVNCFLDPGVEIARGVTRKPVVGPCESSFHIASVLYDRIAVITVGDARTLWMIEERIREIGFHDSLVYLDTIGLGVMDLDKNRERVLKALEEKSRKAIEANAEAIILGCTGLAGLARKLSERIGRPVIDPSGAAMKMAEALARLGAWSTRAP